MKLIVVRHGVTKENDKGILQGIVMGGTLSKEGIGQARKVAERLKEERIDYAYVSDLERAKVTAEEILKMHPETKVFYPKELRERDFGVYNGKPKDELIKVREERGIPFEEFRPEGGESVKDIHERIIKFFDEIFEKRKGKTVLFVSHGMILTTLFLYLFRKPVNRKEYLKYRPKNSALTIMDIEDSGEHKVHVLNCLKHLN
jgi:probable phosphoglycerate mutase